MNKLTNNELADNLDELENYRDGTLKDKEVETLQEAAKRLRGEWIPIDEFLKNLVEGLCWFINDGVVIDGYYYKWSGFLYSDRSDIDIRLQNNITYVIPMNKPEPPK